MDKYILALDQGTTSSRAIVFDLNGKAVSTSQREFTQYTPKESWVEHDAEEIWNTQLSVAREALKDVPGGADSIAAIGITNQRETTVLWDKKTGEPLGRAIVWQCRRSSEICARLKKEGHAEIIRSTTGLVPDPYFSGTKIRWRLENDPSLLPRAEAGEVLFGTIDSWLLWKLTGGKVHATDVSNASRTMLMNLKTGDWDSQMMEILGIPRAMLPEIHPSIGFFGESDPGLFGRSIPITGIAGDQHAALFGHRAFKTGDVKNTYGTGCFMLMNVGSEPVFSPGGLLSTVAWGYGDKLTYALEGSVFMAGAVLQWLRDDLNLISHVHEVDILAEEVPDTAGVYLVPAFQGLGTPWWADQAKGALLGLTRAAKKAHICRAFLESIAYRTRDVIDVMIADSGHSLGRMKVDGGVTRSDFLMRFQSDLLEIPVERPDTLEMTALGAALMAGIGAGIWKDFEDLSHLPSSSTTYKPSMNPERRQMLYEGWKKAVAKVI